MRTNTHILMSMSLPKLMLRRSKAIMSAIKFNMETTSAPVGRLFFINILSSGPLLTGTAASTGTPFTTLIGTAVGTGRRGQAGMVAFGTPLDTPFAFLTVVMASFPVTVMTARRPAVKVLVTIDRTAWLLAEACLMVGARPLIAVLSAGPALAVTVGFLLSDPT